MNIAKIDNIALSVVYKNRINNKKVLIVKFYYLWIYH